MNDPKLLRDNFDEIKKVLEQRGLPESFSLWPALDKERREKIVEIEKIRAEKNALGPQIAKAKKEGTNVDDLLASLKASGEREKDLNEALVVVEAKMQDIELVLPNIPHESVPEGRDESLNREEKKWGEKRKFSFKPRPHWEIGESLGILDFEAGAKLSGARFVVYKGDGARLERALINFMLESHAKRGYKEIMPPLLVRAETVKGSGQLPKFEEDLFKTSDPENRYYLIPTSEVPLCNLHAGEILAKENLPLYFTAYTPCFRAEAGSHGRDVRGLIRLHQFNKVELVKITEEETSYQELDKLVLDAESILEELELPYRRMCLCRGDMGLAASKTYDLEVWLPGQGQEGEEGAYREISSCSNTEAFQARRSNTRYRDENGAKPKFVHMLNGSGLAVGRTLLAILENYQEEDGSVTIPKALRPFMGGQKVLGGERKNLEL